MSDNRKSKRPILIASLEIMLPDRGPKIEGLSLDVSPGGMRIYSPKPLRVGSCIILDIAFQADDGEHITETISAMVKWCKPEENMHAVGIEFNNLDSNEHPNLVAFLEQNRSMKQNKPSYKKS
jgi:c-di-GMP-binding flagellar brake protein YcgR